MAFLDKAGVAHLWGKIKNALSSKQDILTADETISLQNSLVGVKTPVRQVLTQIEYDNLTEDEKSNGLYVISDAEDGDSGGGSFRGEVYSTEETIVGKWINGEPLYRRVFEGLKLPSSPNTQVILTLDSLVQVIKLYGYVDHEGYRIIAPFSLPRLSDGSRESMHISVYSATNNDNTTIKATCSAQLYGLNSTLVVEYIKSSV